MNYKKTLATTVAALGLLIAPIAGEAAQFKDVPANASYKEAVNKLVKYKVISGYSDGTFNPHAPVTRAQAASIMARALALDLNNVQPPGFSDVTVVNGHYGAIAKLTELGVFSKAEKFNPNSPITRVQMAKMLVEAFDLQAANLQTFTDVKTTDWYYEPVGILGALKITHNVEKFEPAGIVTRAHFATFVERVVTYKRGDALEDIWDKWAEWDARGVIQHVVEEPIITPQPEKPAVTPKPESKPEEPAVTPKPETKPEEPSKQPELDAEAKRMIERLEDMQDELKDAKEDVEDAFEELEELIEEEKEEKKIDKAKDELSDELQKLDRQLTKANDLIEQAEELDYTEVNKAIEALRAEVRRATKVSTESYANTSDKDYQEERLEETLEDLEDAIEDAEKALKNKSFSKMEDVYEALQEEIEEAENARESYKDSKVKGLEELDKDVADAVSDAEDLLEEIEEWIEDRLSDQIDNIKKQFKDALADLEDALDEEDKSDIYDAKEALEEAIEFAENIVDDYKGTSFTFIEKDITKLKELIEDAEDELRDAK